MDICNLCTEYLCHFAGTVFENMPISKHAQNVSLSLHTWGAGMIFFRNQKKKYHPCASMFFDLDPVRSIVGLT